MKATTQEQHNEQIIEMLNQKMFEFKYRYIDDISGNIYTNWMTESQFKNCYPRTIVISKTN